MFKDNSKQMMDSFKKVNKEASAVAKKIADAHFETSIQKRIKAIYLKHKFSIETITLKDNDSSKDITKRIPTKFEYDINSKAGLYTSSVEADSPVEAQILEAGFIGTAISISEEIIEYFLGRAPTEEEQKTKYIDPNGMKTIFTNAVKLELKK